jgi:ferric-dicitrate binding protein FerR (iron transport regulator)
MSKQCPRTWEVEAVRDGRLRGAAREAFQRHVRHCADCAREQAALEQLGTRLREHAADGVDDVGARRLRQQILAEANRALLQPRERSRRWLRPSLGLALIALLAALSARVASRRAAVGEVPRALQLTAAKGARFTHERRRDLEYVELYEGSLDIRFDHRSRLTLVVRTPDGEVRDFGTTFRVTVARGHTSDVSVREGAVLLQRHGFEDVLLHAGEAFHAPANPEPLPPSAASDAGTAPAQPAHPPRARAAKARAAATREQPATRSGAEEEDRSYLHVLELLHAGQTDAARAAAAAYLQEFPNGFRRPEVERIARINQCL